MSHPDPTQEYDEDPKDLYSNAHYINVKRAVIDAARGTDALSAEDLAYAITAGLYEWGPASQEKYIYRVAQALCAHMDRPVKIVDLTIKQ